MTPSRSKQAAPLAAGHPAGGGGAAPAATGAGQLFPRYVAAPEGTSGDRPAVAGLDGGAECRTSLMDRETHGLVADITNNAPTNGSYHVQFQSWDRDFHDVHHDAFLVQSTASGARAQSSPFTIYPRQYLTNVSNDATTSLYKEKHTM